MARDTETTTTYTIPTNYTNAGKIFGMFELRSMAEAAVAALVTIYPIVTSNLSVQMKIFISLALGLAIVFFVGSGIRGDSLTQFLGNVIRHLRNRRKLSYSQIIPESKEVMDHAKKTNKKTNKKAGKNNSGETPRRKVAKKTGKEKEGKANKAKSK